jgi:16S rRNA (guanine527-N7)-methyltransferase
VQQQNWQTQLSNGLNNMAIQLSKHQQNQLLDYLALLNKWNKVFNLTAIRDAQKMVSRQLLDSLSILPWIKGPRVLDVGTGAGLPGIPLAVALPETQFALLDSNGKKIRFVQQAVGELGLDNVTVQQVRVEAFEDTAGFNTITSRAFADLHDMIKLTQHLRAPNGQWAAMKASIGELDKAALPEGMQHEVIELQIPHEPAVRHLIRVFV